MAESAVHPWAFKQAMRTLVGGVTVIAARSGESYLGITATAVCSLSAEPPSLLVCINRSASLATPMRAGLRFSVNILGAGHEHTASMFAGMTGARGQARFASGSWHRSENDVPFLVDARSSLECEAVEVLERYTHLIVIGNVIAIRVADTSEPALASAGGAMAPVSLL
jgi:flavin reductase (DIM6/NTAB) family NADH-FMN oxidoreductase RutF